MNSVRELIRTGAADSLEDRLVFDNDARNRVRLNRLHNSLSVKLILFSGGRQLSNGRNELCRGVAKYRPISPRWLHFAEAFGRRAGFEVAPDQVKEIRHEDAYRTIRKARNVVGRVTSGMRLKGEASLHRRNDQQKETEVTAKGADALRTAIRCSLWFLLFGLQLSVLSHGSATSTPEPALCS